MDRYPERTGKWGTRVHSARLAFVFLQRRIGADGLAWIAGLLSAMLLRYDFDAGRTKSNLG